MPHATQSRRPSRASHPSNRGTGHENAAAARTPLCAPADAGGAGDGCRANRGRGAAVGLASGRARVRRQTLQESRLGLLAASDQVTLDDDVLFAASFLHDMAAFAPWEKKKVDHSDEAARIVAGVLQDTGFPMAKIDAVRAAVGTQKSTTRH